MNKPALKLIIKKCTGYEKHISIAPNSQRRGTAQYNFIPVNDIIICYQPDDKNTICHDVFCQDLNSGEMECELTTKSEVFIGDGSENFFSVNGKPLIPGSTLRGLIRNMVSIMTYGKMTQIDGDRTLFTRPFADEDRLLRDWYNNQLTDPKRGEKRKSYTANAGYLYHNQKEGKYYIQPSEEHDNKQYTQVQKTNMTGELYPEKIKPFGYYKRRDGSYYVTSGAMNKKKHEWHIYAPDSRKDPIPVPITTIMNYQKDCKQANPSRTIKFNLLETLKNRKSYFKEGIPVIYKERNNIVVAFGHTGLFRIAYEKSIGDHLSSDHLNHENIDITERMFGRIAEIDLGNGKYKSDAHASFIQVSDAIPIGDVKMGIEKKVILSGPKPTAFQNYLVQKHTEINGKNHWGQTTLLRGQKMYWHHPFKLPDYSKVKSDKMFTRMQPIAEGNQFKFKIRFNNLTNIELGALISAIQLPEGCAHKLGMAKALGLGSVQLEANLKLEDPKTRYSRLFENGQWKIGSENEKNLEHFAAMHRNIIKKYCYNNSEYDKGKLNKFWSLYRMKQLRKILSVEAGEKAARKGQLNDQGYDTKKRKILPIPEDV